MLFAHILFSIETTKEVLIVPLSLSHSLCACVLVAPADSCWSFRLPIVFGDCSRLPVLCDTWLLSSSLLDFLDWLIGE